MGRDSEADRTPSFPPTRIVIDVPLEGEPCVVDKGGLADYLLEAVLIRCAEQFETVYVTTFQSEGGTDE